MTEIKKKVLALDIETFSDVDLPKCGVYAYADSQKFEILLVAYAFDEDDVSIIDLAQGEKIPMNVIEAIKDKSIIKTAFNAAFERVCFSRHLGVQLEPASWQCTSVQASMLSLPLSLDGVGQVLNIERKKLKEGVDLIRYFSLPCKPTKSNGGRIRNLPEHDLEKWNRYKNYCIRDVEAEREIRQKLKKFPIPIQEQQNYELDQEINDRGVEVDKELVRKTVELDLIHKGRITTEAYELTGLENPNSAAQLKEWLGDQGIEAESLNKKAVKDLIEVTDGEVYELLKLRQEMAKTSVKKYEAIERSVTRDGRVHGLFQFYGANRTGRFAGRLVQVQNLPQNHLPDLDLARSLVREGRLEDIDLLFDSVPGVLSELIRTAFIPREGTRFIVTDFSAIEARVLAWLSGENWRLDVFQSHGKIYEASASAMFKVPLEEIGKGSPLRQKGKISELALGYGGSIGALKAMGAIEMGLTDEELPDLVKQWRAANPYITKFWWEVDAAALEAVKEKTTKRVGKIEFYYRSGILFVTLPSGRKLSYIKPRIEKNKFGRDGLTYEGIGESRKWMRIETYGPKLVENIVQAASRDLLTEAMLRLRNNGFDIVMHVHDEIVLEVEQGKSSVKEICQLMAMSPEWAEGLPLRADGYECSYYKKD